MVPRASISEGAHLHRRRVLQALAADAQARADAQEIQHADQIWLPVRLRAVPGSRAAFVPDADRSDGRLQPDVPDLLQRVVAVARLVASNAGADRVHDGLLR